MVAMMGAGTLIFHEFRACGAPKFFGKKDPVARKHRFVDTVNAFHTTRCPNGEKVRFSSCLLKDRDQDWWEEVGHVVGGKAIESMTWENFVTRFWSEFALVIEVQLLT